MIIVTWYKFEGLGMLLCVTLDGSVNKIDIYHFILNFEMSLGKHIMVYIVLFLHMYLTCRLQ